MYYIFMHLFYYASKYQAIRLCDVNDYVYIEDGVNIEDVDEDRGDYVNNVEYEIGLAILFQIYINFMFLCIFVLLVG